MTTIHLRFFISLFTYLFFSQLFIVSSFGQTVLISPTVEGGFEVGGTFAANGWTSVNSGSNFWVTDNNAPAFVGVRGAHVSLNGAAYDYSNAISATSHFYRDVVIPAGATAITLTFQWKGNGESGWDRMLFYTAPTTVTPVANVPASSGTALAGATLVWTQPNNAQAAYTSANIVLPVGLAGTTVRLIFTWQGDNTIGVSPPAAIDNISLVYTPASLMTYTSSTSVDVALGGNAEKCELGVQMTRVEIVTGGGLLTPLTLSQLLVNKTGTAGVGTIDRVHVYYTGTSPTFSPINEFVVGGLAPLVSLTFNDTRTLALGTNYFWVVYDFNNTGTIGNTIGAQLPAAGSLTVGGIARNPTSNPSCLKTYVACATYPNTASLWLKGNAGTNTTVNGAAVSSWNSQAVAPVVSVTQATAGLQPIYREGSGTGVLNRFNYNPSIYTDGTSNRLVQAGNIDLGNTTNGFSVYQVIGEDLGVVAMDWYHNVNGNIKIKGDALMYINNASGAVQQNVYGDVFTVQGFLQSLRGVPNGIVGNGKMNGVTGASYGNGWRVAATTGISIGSNLDNGEFMQGGMGEFIVFPSILNSSLNLRVESYLAVKYGITLGTAAAPSNYVSSDGTIIWSANSTYQNNIIGIGRDNAVGSSLLLQKQSHYYTDEMRLYKGALASTNNNNASAFAVDKSFVIVGSNTGVFCATVASNAEKPASCGLYSRMEREWRATRTNMAEDFNMDIKLAACGAPGSVAVADLRLLIDDDGNFGNGGTTCYSNVTNPGLFTYSNPTITVTGITSAMIPNNATRFLTIGSVQVVTPLPIELLAFDANLNQKRTVDLTWTTATEHNSDYYIAEKSLDLQNWENVCFVQAAGNSTNELDYACEDSNPFLGLNYYRLKQVDLDGSFKYSETRVVSLESSQEVLIYPNPTNSIFSIQGKDIESKEIKLFNSLGQEVQLSLIASSMDLSQYDTNDLKDGIYYLKVTTGLDSRTYKLIVLKNK